MIDRISLSNTVGRQRLLVSLDVYGYYETGHYRVKLYIFFKNFKFVYVVFYITNLISITNSSYGDLDAK